MNFSADDMVADCFNDWRRSTLLEKLGFLLHHDLLTPEEYAGLPEETFDKTLQHVRQVQDEFNRMPAGIRLHRIPLTVTTLCTVEDLHL